MLAEAGVTYVFANLGSDHPPLIEAMAQARAEGRADALPKVIVCPTRPLPCPPRTLTPWSPVSRRPWPSTWMRVRRTSAAPSATPCADASPSWSSRA